jgi:hypothetical protein
MKKAITGEIGEHMIHFELADNAVVYCCQICTVPCFAFTNSIPPDRCIRGDLDCSDKANWKRYEKVKP